MASSAARRAFSRPYLVDGTTELGVPRTEDYHFNVDITDKAIAWIRATRSLTPDRPFFMYYATGGAHPPHTPPKEWLDVYKGKFDQGWDKLREEILERQIKMGLMPRAPRSRKIRRKSRSGIRCRTTRRRFFRVRWRFTPVMPSTRIARCGRLIDAIEELGELDNTIVIYIAGDNGGTAIGGLNGTFNEWSNLNGAPEDISYLKTRMHEYGGPNFLPELFGRLGHGRIDASDVVHQRLPRRRSEPGHGHSLAKGLQSQRARFAASTRI